MKKAMEPIERRKYRRYIVRGRMRFTIDSLEVWAEMVNFGEGGVLMRSMFDLPVGTRLDLRVLAFGYPLAVEGIGQVVGGRGDLLAIQFIEKSPEAAHFLRWLEMEHYPWTGTFDDPAAEARLQPNQAASTEDSWNETRAQARVERIEEEIFQRA
jgi:hypothetical protein